ncbi:trypsin-like peptidase domain-containing protein [Caenimonas soli]|uniref:trypsin-like peptidase domain-containing protein n=1 Tax=Caenimonas soli TaxID=2735555 RepID=UPI001551D367|nr:trypsin-like peptidase domain-containing protein [Caenimonas soli]NPC55900.1 PDZ domain-containing protein [Caenimonas soli]
MVSVVVLRARRDPLEDIEGFDFFHAVSGLPLGDGAGATLERSTSSGFVIGADGYILTNAHGVFDARETWVVTTDGRRFRAGIVGLDRSSDVALLKISASGLAVAQVASLGHVCPGEWVAALGAPFGFDHSLTVGIVSAYPRFLPGGGAGMPLIQSDVVLNPGSSGGPLFNTDGLVVGMNSMIFSASGIYIGVSFSLPIDRVMRIAAGFRSGTPRGHVGLRTQPVTPELGQAFGLAQPRGALVTRVSAGSPAEEAGLRSGDILLAVDGKSFDSQLEFEEAIGGARPGAVLALQVWRHKALQRVAVKVTAPTSDLPPPGAPVPAGDAARLGLVLSPVSATKGMPAGAYVETASGAGLLAGIEPGDRITAVNGIDVASSGDFDTALESIGKSKVVALLVARGPARIYIPVIRHDQ